MEWASWSLDRVLILFVSLAFLMIGIQVTLYHYRQNFHHAAMWVPVIATPVFFVAGLLLSFNNASWIRGLFQVLMWIGAVAGLAGFYFHVSGVGKRVGGWAFRNFLIGPPVVLPLMITAMSALGLVALYWTV
ncbi:hypothetical protein LQV63_10515 [Paenibacillus profundus]|uniref:Uncharacterized protein n=1 Tax=Paenibacillus profundus TaxID=1173085 RepID=A0ABS8YHU1_9BACL|nr:MULTISPECIES: hypothetical protein [Paenibacillus]MCE5169747.1 hypothetical protein [Paenibacillus profundus]MCM3341074.1 hypothetical protein [Paenibacillus sp. MER TA 81-3]